MQYKKTNTIFGKWVKTSELVNVRKAKIVSETIPQPSQFLNKDGTPKTQDVCRVQFEGISEALNVGLNRPTINGLVDAYGEDSVQWQGHALSVETEKVRIAGRAVTVLYLIPEGYEKTDDANGYALILKMRNKELAAKGSDNNIPPISDADFPADTEEEELDASQIPF